jgi:hypothetical protein
MRSLTWGFSTALTELSQPPGHYQQNLSTGNERLARRRGK